MSVATKVYLAGPMTYIPHFNFPAFDEAAARLRAAGDEVVSPAELDDPSSRAAAMASLDGDPAEYARLTGLSWADFLSRDVKIIAEGGFEEIIVLPGWEKSRGARLETFVGHLHGIVVREYTVSDTFTTGIGLIVHPHELAKAWADVTDFIDPAHEHYGPCDVPLCGRG